DAYLLKSVLHDWSDADAVRILRIIHGAARPGARVLLAEAVLQPGNQPDLGKILDLEMLVMTSGGRERGAAEGAEGLRAGRCHLGRVISTASPLCLLDATRC